MAEPRDAIDDLVDWQLSQRKPTDTLWRTCSICRTGWQALIPVCPHCGAAS